MKIKLFYIIALLNILTSCQQKRAKEVADELTLKEALDDKFLIGTALNQWQVAGDYPETDKLIKRHFNSVVAENCMKSEVIHPEENRYDFTLADDFVNYGEENNMFIIGHCLIWHSQLSPWFCVDSLGNNVEPEVLKKRMKDHIYTIVGRYKDRIHGWDVVNEAINDDGTYRNSKFYEILGEEYIPLAFQYANEADPNAELYYNDYSMFKSARRNSVIKMAQSMRDKGIRIDAIGMQGHYVMGGPTIEEVEESVQKFGQAGFDVMFTEFDMALLPRNAQGADISAREDGRDATNPYAESVPEDVSQEWNAWMKSFFDMFARHSDIISRVTMCGVIYGDSLLNDWPVKGRTDHTLLFDLHYQPQPFVREMLLPKRAIIYEFIYEVAVN